MFDSVLGLPLHPLVVHAVVVLGPLGALAALAYAARPAWRTALRWPVLALAVITGVSAVVAAASGEALLLRLSQDSSTSAEEFALVARHESLGETTRLAALLFLVVAVVCVQWVLRPGAVPRGALPVSATVVLGLTAVWVLVQIALTGHAGSAAVWS